MGRKIAIDIGNATAHHCKDCEWKHLTANDGMTKYHWICDIYDRKLSETIGGDIVRCHACRKAEIQTERRQRP